MSIHLRIKAEREARGWSMEQLAVRIAEAEGLPKPLAWQTIQQWEKEGGTAPKRKRLEAVAQVFGITVAELMGSSPSAPSAPGAPNTQIAAPPISQVVWDIPQEPGYVRLQHLSPRPSMGPGNALSEPMQVVRHLDVLESWVRQKVGSTSYDRIKILTGCGHSMKPTIQDQDLIFVDIGYRTIDIPGIYVIDVYGRFLLKRALILSDGTLVLRSDNIEEFPDEERIDLRKASDTVNIAGKVQSWWTLKQG